MFSEDGVRILPPLHFSEDPTFLRHLHIERVCFYPESAPPDPGEHLRECWGRCEALSFRRLIDHLKSLPSTKREYWDYMLELATRYLSGWKTETGCPDTGEAFAVLRTLTHDALELPPFAMLSPKPPPAQPPSPPPPPGLPAPLSAPPDVVARAYALAAYATFAECESPQWRHSDTMGCTILAAECAAEAERLSARPSAIVSHVALEFCKSAERLGVDLSPWVWLRPVVALAYAQKPPGRLRLYPDWVTPNPFVLLERRMVDAFGVREAFLKQEGRVVP
ncbi:uncharacterized protein BXZ73DRAFT_107053 [Epithele typhae]|uniref:uncharacterized protein n=1 Tax=Epithele typhae TaxID=378194 RepID=UPI0020075888|nr:uncharacterized protein BXZ73DRAFT_107053 [Epithele typhae]KAH9913076.1 hypothetical protein BXZ73DRAFT_107053 [Epithele typhae]